MIKKIFLSFLMLIFLFSCQSFGENSKRSFSLDLYSGTLLIGDIIQLKINITNDDIILDQLKWSSSNPDIISVSSDGVLTAVSKGVTIITVTSEIDKSYDHVSIQVLSPQDFEGDNPFSWVNSKNDPFMPVWDSKKKGRVPNTHDTREEIIIDETFSVHKNTTFNFKNKIIWVKPSKRGNIEINGTLVIENCLLLWVQTEHQQCRLVVNDGGTLNIKNSYAFWGNKYWVNWNYNDGSTIKLDRFVGDPWTTIRGSVDYTSKNYSTVKLTLLSDAKNVMLNISDAHHIWMELYPPVYSTIDISFPKKREWISNWDLNNIWPESDISIKNSYMFERDLSLDNGVNATVRDTDGFAIGWAFSNSGKDYITCTIDSLGDPDMDEGVYYSDKTWNVPGNNSSLRIINSTFQRAWPVVFGRVHLIVKNSNLVDPRIFNGKATYEVYNSTIDNFAAYRGGKAYLENCRIRDDIEAKDAGTIVYGYNVTNRELTPYELIEVDGGRYSKLEMEGSPF